MASRPHWRGGRRERRRRKRRRRSEETAAGSGRAGSALAARKVVTGSARALEAVPEDVGRVLQRRPKKSARTSEGGGGLRGAPPSLALPSTRCGAPPSPQQNRSA